MISFNKIILACHKILILTLIFSPSVSHSKDGVEFVNDWSVYINTDNFASGIEALTIARLAYGLNIKAPEGAIEGNRIFYFATGEDFIVDQTIQPRAMIGFPESAFEEISSERTGDDSCFVGSYRFSDGVSVSLAVHSSNAGGASSLDCLVAGIWFQQRGSLEGYRSEYWWVLLRELLQVWEN